MLVVSYGIRFGSFCVFELVSFPQEKDTPSEWIALLIMIWLHYQSAVTMKWRLFRIAAFVQGRIGKLVIDILAVLPLCNTSWGVCSSFGLIIDWIWLLFGRISRPRCASIETPMRIKVFVDSTGLYRYIGLYRGSDALNRLLTWIEYPFDWATMDGF